MDILDAARQLFVEQGYAATTLTSIAEQANVSVDTIYGAYRSKPGLFRALITASIRGDEEPVPLRERAAIHAIRAEPDARAKLRLYGSLLAEINPRHAPLVRALRDAARADSQLAEIWERHKQDRLDGMTEFAAHLQATAALRPELSESDARDVLWTLNSTDVYDLVACERGWTSERYGDWIAQQLIAALLPSVG